MYRVNATELKNRLGPLLARAEIEPVAILRYGRVVAHLVPAQKGPKPRAASARAARRLSRAEEERIARLCASGDLRPSRWMRAGDRRVLAGVAVMLASQPEFDRVRLLALAERLFPGMSTADEFAKWLERATVKAARLLPVVRREMRRSGR